jgi:putative transposase
MTVAITRKELGASELRREAVRGPEARAARRMLAWALVLEGHAREAAARHTGMDRQTLRDWVHRYNAQGLAGLCNRRHVGPKPRLTPEPRGEREPDVEPGPDPARDGVVRGRRVDLQALIKARFDVDRHERSVGKVLHRLGFARLSVRPKHPSSQPEAQETFKKLRSIGAGGAARARGRQAARDLVPRRGPCRPAGHLDPGLGAPRHPPAGTA